MTPELCCTEIKFCDGVDLYDLLVCVCVNHTTACYFVCGSSLLEDLGMKSGDPAVSISPI